MEFEYWIHNGGHLSMLGKFGTDMLEKGYDNSLKATCTFVVDETFARGLDLLEEINACQKHFPNVTFRVVMGSIWQWEWLHDGVKIN